MSMLISAKIGKKFYQGFFLLVGLSMAGIPTIVKVLFDQSQSVAVVNGNAISPQEYQEATMAHENQLAMIRQRFGGSMHISDELLRSLGINTNAREAALDNLVTEKLIASVAQKMHLVVDREYIAQFLCNPNNAQSLFGAQIPHNLFNEQGRIDAERLKIFLKHQGKTIEAFDKMIEEKMKQQLVMFLVKEALPVSSAGREEYKLSHFAPKTFKITTISYAPYVKEVHNQPSQEEVHAYFAKQNNASQKYWSSEKRQGTIWAFKQKAYDIASGKPAGDFEQRFTTDTQGMLGAPQEVFTAFAQQKNGSKRSIAATPDASGKAEQLLMSLNPGRRSLYFEDGVGYIVELTSVEKPHARALEAVQAQVAADLAQEKAQKTVMAILKESGGKPLAGSEKIFTVTVQPQDEKALEPLRKQGIKAEKLARMFRAGQSYTEATNALGYKVELVSVGSVDEALAMKDMEAHKDALVQDIERRLAYDFIASLRENATIVMNPSLLKGL